MKNQNIKTQKGITLVALVITIIVLIILAVVAIGALQNHGIINYAKNARAEYEAATEKENTILGNYLAKIEENVPGNSGEGNEENEGTGNENEGSDENQGNGSEGTGGNQGDNSATTSTVLEAQGKVLSTTSNTVVADEYGNTIVVPAGFKITTDASKVTEGIVIEDCTELSTAGSQFVWVPVGKIYTNTAKTEYKTINLDRYTFASDGTPTPQGEAVINGCWQELATSTYGNATAKDLQGFINSVNAKGGYYIGRYEAGNSSNTLVCKANQVVYVNVTQPEASDLSRSMYTSSNFTSDLINSYAWDTAIIFIQTFGGCANYASKNFSTSFVNTGINNDKYCNIYDMSGNAMEWSTETSSRTSSYADDLPCVYRGGYCGSFADDYTCTRGYHNTTDDDSSISFRPLLYVAL